MRLVLTFAALFLSVILLQLSSGGVAPLDALEGLAAGFTTTQVGMLGSAHFLGFFIGCWWAPRLLGAVGHSRSFATFTALGAIGVLGHTLILDPYAWAVLRIASGLCIAGCYTVVESWLQAKVTNSTRGRTMGIYRFADITGSLVAQLMVGLLANLETYLAYNILTLFSCLALLPLMLTRQVQPPTPAAPRLRPGLAVRCSALAVAGVLTAAVSGASFRMVGPVYGQQVGLDAGQIGLFLAVFVAGGALAQYPAGWLADKYDRRRVLIWVSVAAMASCGITVALAPLGPAAVLVCAALFGLTTFPIYSVSAAHAHDFATGDERVELSAALMFWYAAGAIAAPVLTSLLIEGLGPPALFGVVALAHLGLILFGLWRMRLSRVPQGRTRYVYAPRTSFTIGRLLGRDRDRP